MAALIRRMSFRSLKACSKSGIEFSFKMCKFRVNPYIWHRRSSSSSMNLLNLKERDLLEMVYPDNRMPELMKLMSNPQSVYCGFDPTADSLHVGNLLSIIALLHAQRAGHNPIIVIGGATALIGDPSGKIRDRVPLTAETIENNIIAIMESVQHVINNHREFIYKENKSLPEFRFFNNYDWYKDKDIITFLSTTVRYFRVGEMISKHSVQSRLNSEAGISCTEFMYQVLQGHDWLHLYQNHNCTIQIGGIDQMGNISAGFDLIHKVTHEIVFGFFVPLILSPSGKKLGKSTGDCVWLNPNKSSPFELYQYFFNMPDSLVERYLKLFTFLPLEEIEAVVEKHNRSPENRHGQKKLAEQITLLVHGESGLDSALRFTEVLFGDAKPALSAMQLSELQQLFRDAPTKEVTYNPGITVFELCRMIKCFPGDWEADKVIKGGGLYINQQRITDPNHLLIDGVHILPNNVTLVRVGRKNFHVVRWLV